MSTNFIISYGIGGFLGAGIPILIILAWPDRALGFCGRVIGFFMDRIQR